MEIKLSFKNQSREAESMNKSNDWTIEELKKDYIGTMKAITIPINISIQGQQQVLDTSAAERILRNAKLITLEDCSCRIRWKKCDAPLDVCLSMNGEARDALKRGAKPISVQEALKVLERSHKAGLVHLAFIYEGKKKPEIICSCCSCCCHSMNALVRFGLADHVIASEYVASQNGETCDNCGNCIERCQFNARKLLNDKLYFAREKCFGCGLRISTCPTNSVSLVKRKS
jgi:ferredoxin